jgi:1-acyl-sn-glycerol-3-phosphate acyltransferase
MSRVGLAVRLAAMAAAFLVLAPVQWAIIRKGSARAGALPLVLHRLFLRLFGIRLSVLGKPPEHGAATLVLANHVSWLDIPIMASTVPLSFVAKQEIAGWPLFGLCARLQGCVFLDRTRKAATAEVNREVADRLAQGEVIVLFPEGTTGDGNRLLPFRSSIVGAARAALAGSAREEISLQPLAIAYTRRSGLPVTRRERPDIAWYGDTELAPHLVAFTKRGPLDVVLAWCEPIPFGPGDDRKRATQAAEAAVRAALQDLARPATRGPHQPRHTAPARAEPEPCS